MTADQRNDLRERVMQMAERANDPKAEGGSWCAVHDTPRAVFECRECFDALAAIAIAATGGSTLTGSPHSLDALAMDIAAWQRETFPHATPESTAAHLLREAQELVANPRDPSEGADILHLVIGWAQANGFDLGAVLAEKFATNRARRWGVRDAEGVVEHVRDPVT